MAQKIQTLFIDDINGGEAKGTVRFGLDGTDYEIDLSTANSEKLHTALAAYVAHARRAPGTARRAPRGKARGTSSIDTTEVRAWAKDHGYDIKDRGRVPTEIVTKYREATGN